LNGYRPRLLAAFAVALVVMPARAAVADQADAAADEPVIEVEAVEVVKVIQATCTRACDDPAVDEEVEAVEVVEVVQQVEEVEAVVAIATGPADETAWSAWQVVGRFHPAFVHLPIGFLLLLLILELLALVRRSPGLAACGLAAHVLTALAAVPAVLSGFLRSAEMWTAGGPPGLLVRAQRRGALGLRVAAGRRGGGGRLRRPPGGPVGLRRTASALLTKSCD
jgi:hypothetical protein